MRRLVVAKFALLLGLGLWCAGRGLTANAQRGSIQPAVEGCTQAKNIYTCDWETFRRALGAAHTVAVPVSPMDRFTAVQLRELAGALGKSVAAKGQAGDLVFSVLPVDSTGIDFGPRDRPLATLQVYAPEPDSGRKTLLWVETYTGQPDRPWAADVKAVIDQFRKRVNKR